MVTKLGQYARYLGNPKEEQPINNDKKDHESSLKYWEYCEYLLWTTKDAFYHKWTLYQLGKLILSRLFYVWQDE